MSVYRDETAALRHKLEREIARAARSEAKLRRYELGREHRWNGDIALFVARALLVVVPLSIASLLVLYFGVGVAMLGIFDDTRALMALFALFSGPIFIAGPLAAWKTETPSRAGWGLALFSYAYLLALVPPVGLYGLVTLLRGRTRDAVFGATTTGLRVPSVETEEVVADLEEEVVAETVQQTERPSRSEA